MLEWIRFGLSAALTGWGLFVLITAVLGVFRFRFSLNRIHAAALVDTMGALSLLSGLLIAVGLETTALKLLALLALLWLSSPVASHLIGRLEVTVGEDLDRRMRVRDPELTRRSREGM